MCSSQSFCCSITAFRKYSYGVRLNGSTISSDCGWSGVVRVFLISYKTHIPLNTVDSKFLPWSECSSIGTPVVHKNIYYGVRLLIGLWYTLPVICWCNTLRREHIGFRNYWQEKDLLRSALSARKVHPSYLFFFYLTITLM